MLEGNVVLVRFKCDIAFSRDICPCIKWRRWRSHCRKKNLRVKCENVGVTHRGGDYVIICAIVNVIY